MSKLFDNETLSEILIILASALIGGILSSDMLRTSSIYSRLFLYIMGFFIIIIGIKIRRTRKL